MTELLDAVDALTKPYQHTMRDTDGEAVTGTRPPRFQQLAEAVRGSGGTGQGGTERRARTPLDWDALQRWYDIVAELNQEAERFDVKIHRDPSVTLRRWYAAVLGRTLTDTYSREWERRLESWADWIDRKLDPPFQMEINRPCPLCQERRYVNEDGDEAMAVLAEVDARDVGHTTYRIWCRACEQVAHGIEAVREWAYDIEHADTQTA